ncbi:MAG: TlpA family protein disulfide reductase [Tannerella sp.]|jgi:thiol-disulfide isomerase/thioredoxin|nr:TlpA family protein disulfide reductase [Tannerella sp.]
MKQFLLTIILAAVATATTVAKDKIIVNPAYEFSNSGITHISKIELGENETRLHVRKVHGHYEEANFSRTDFIEDCATGKRYHPETIINGEFDREIHISDSGDSTVILIFPPLDKSVTKINYYDNAERIAKNRATIYGISLNPDTKPRTDSEIPDSVSRWIDGELAKAKRQTLMNIDAGEFFAEDDARLIGYIKGYDPRAGFSTGLIYFKNRITREEYPQTVRVHEDGRFECNLPLNHPVYQNVTFEFIGFPFYLQPGQTLAMLLDWDDFLKADRYGKPIHKFLHTQFRGGALAELNRELKAFDDKLPVFEYWTIINEEFNKAPDEYRVFYDELEYFSAYRWLLESGNLSGEAKAILENIYKARYAYYLLRYADQYDYDNQDEPLPVAFYDFLQNIPMNDKEFLSADYFDSFISSLEYCGPFFKMYLQSYETISREKSYIQYLFEELGLTKTQEDETYILLSDSVDIIESLGLTEEQQLKLRKKCIADGEQFFIRHKEHWEEYSKKYVENTAIEISAEERRLKDSVYFREFKLEPGIIYDVLKVQSLDNVFKNKTNASKESAQHFLNALTKDFTEPFLRQEAERIFYKNYPVEQLKAHPLPDTYEASIFKELIAPFKGKVLWVDFWATSCPPCVSNIERDKELRKKYKDSPDVAFIFITDEESSPKARYDKFVAEQELTNTCLLKADRYRYLRQLFQFNGIPRYVLVDRNGDILFNGHLAHGHEMMIQDALR